MKRPTNAAAVIVERSLILGLIFHGGMGKIRHVSGFLDGVISREHLRSPTSNLGLRAAIPSFSPAQARGPTTNHVVSAVMKTTVPSSKLSIGTEIIASLRHGPSPGWAKLRSDSSRGKHQRKHQQRSRQDRARSPLRQRRRCLEFHHCQDRQRWDTAAFQVRHSGSNTGTQPWKNCLLNTVARNNNTQAAENFALSTT